MSATLDPMSGNDGRTPQLHRTQQRNGANCTKRVRELEALVARLQAALISAEDELQREKTRPPEVGEFVRCPLTNFFGRVTKVTPRPQGRAWIEILPYLTKDFPGHATMDLFDSWELIDSPCDLKDATPPAASSASPTGLPSVHSFEWPRNTASQPAASEIEGMISELWPSQSSTASR